MYTIIYEETLRRIILTLMSGERKKGRRGQRKKRNRKDELSSSPGRKEGKTQRKEK